MKFLKIIFVLSVLFSTSFLFAQDLNVKFSGYLDTYYATDNDSEVDALSGGKAFSYINPIKDQMRLNIAQISSVFNYKGIVRGNVTLHAGDLAHTAWEGLAQYPMIQQANAGFQFAENFWVDAGYFLTHIGGEVLLPKDNWLASHSIVTYFEPFYQSGVRVSYESEKFTGQLHILNGNGIFEDNNFNKSFGVFLSYIPMEHLTVSYANVIGNEVAGKPENARLFMIHNVCASFKATHELELKGQVDIASLEGVGNQDALSYMGLSVQGKYEFTDKIGAALRFAYVDNEKALFAPEVKGMEITLGLDYKPAPISYIKLEGRMFSFDDKYKIFEVGHEPSASAMEVSLNFGVILE